MAIENQNNTVIRNFAPSWFAASMGTGIIPIALMLDKKVVPAFLPLAQFFFVVNLVLFITILIPWLSRFFKYSAHVKKDLSHPVLASFFPTFGIAVMLLAVNFMVVGKTLIGEATAFQVAFILFIIGSISIISFGLVIFPLIFLNNKIDLSHGNFGWFIPAVSHMFITLIGLDLMAQYKGTNAALGLFVFSMLGFGVGCILFIYIGTAVYHRYLYHEILAPKLAATLFIGLVPPAVITIICEKMTNAVTYITYFNSIDAIVSMAKLIGLITWGFAVWWFVFASIVVINHIINKRLPYALSWWAFTFPTGALAVSTGSLNKLLKLSFFDYGLTAIIVIMLTIWLTVALRTLKGVMDKSVFQA
jgi:C4-dicarboxylate transporter/malic acid transport protein